MSIRLIKHISVEYGSKDDVQEDAGGECRCSDGEDTGSDAAPRKQEKRREGKREKGKHMNKIADSQV